MNMMSCKHCMVLLILACPQILLSIVHSFSAPSPSNSFRQRHDELKKKFEEYEAKLQDHETQLKVQLENYELQIVAFQQRKMAEMRQAQAQSQEESPLHETRAERRQPLDPSVGNIIAPTATAHTQTSPTKNADSSWTSSTSTSTSKNTTKSTAAWKNPTVSSTFAATTMSSTSTNTKKADPPINPWTNKPAAATTNVSSVSPVNRVALDQAIKNPHVKEHGALTEPSPVQDAMSSSSVSQSQSQPQPTIDSLQQNASSTATPPAPAPYKQFADSVSNADLADKYFQLSEQEDEFSCLTELWLRPDGYVEVRETDGPRPKEWSGTWSIVDHADRSSTNHKGDVQFELTLYRKFGAGDMFSFFIARRFAGSFYHIGRAGSSTKLLGVEGTAREVDEFNAQVGTFTMIDATHLRQSGQHEISPKKGVGAGAFWRTKLVMNIEQQ